MAACAGLPLALSISAGRASGHPKRPLAELAAELADVRGRLDALEADDAAADVRAVLSWSYDQLSPAAARMFRLLGLHPGPDISLSAAASLAGIGRAEAGAALRELTRTNMAAEHLPGRFAFHGLLRAYAAEAAERTDTEPHRRAAAHRVLDHYLHTAMTATTGSARTGRRCGWMARSRAWCRPGSRPRSRRWPGSTPRPRCCWR